MRPERICVVGGGASGLTAAIAAAREGADVVLLEQKEMVGKKILSTGNGRCNLTNLHIDDTCYRSDDRAIVGEVLARFGAKEALCFFEELGVLTKDRDGYVYPVNHQAAAVREALSLELKRLGVKTHTLTRAKRIERSGDGFRIETAQKNPEQPGDDKKAARRVFNADRVILSAGGRAFPSSGSDGSGYTLAKSMGHTLSPVVPALVQLLSSRTDVLKKLAGVRVDAKIELYVNGQCLASDTGEVQMTEYGISGIPAFQVSRYGAKALYYKETVTAVLNFWPSMKSETFLALLKGRTEKWRDDRLEDFLHGLFPRKLAPVLLAECRLPGQMKVERLTEGQLVSLAFTCQHFKMPVTGTKSFEQAQVCAGGVHTGEVKKDTLESICVNGLYLTGELLDVDGICGGYNLQWAWATGYIAGRSAALCRAREAV